LWAKIQKQRDSSKFESDSDFLEIGELWSTYFDVFEKLLDGLLQATKYFWAKVEKQKVIV